MRGARLAPDSLRVHSGGLRVAAGCRGRAETVGRSLAADGAADVACVFPGRLVKVAAAGRGLFPLIRAWRSINGGRLSRD